MTINQHHIYMLKQASAEAEKIAALAKAAEMRLTKDPGPRNDVHATQIGTLTAETMRSLIKAFCNAEMLTELLKEARPSKK